MGAREPPFRALVWVLCQQLLPATPPLPPWAKCLGSAPALLWKCVTKPLTAAQTPSPSLGPAGTGSEAGDSTGGLLPEPPTTLPRSPHLLGAAGQRYAGAVQAMWLLLCSWQLSSPLGSELKNNILRQRLAASSLHVLGAGSLPPAPALTPPGRTHHEPPAPFGQQKVFFSCKTPGKGCPTPRALLQARAPRGFASLAGSREEFPSVQQPQSNPPLLSCLKNVSAPPRPPLRCLLFCSEWLLASLHKASFSLPFLETSAVLPRKLPPQKATSRTPPRRK